MESLKLQRLNPYALGLLCRLMEGSPPADAICLLNELYDRERDRDFLVHVLRDTRLSEVLLYYAREGDDHPDAFERFLCAGKLHAAAGILADSAGNLSDIGSMLAAEGKADSGLMALIPKSRIVRQDAEPSDPQESVMRRKQARLASFAGGTVGIGKG